MVACSLTLLAIVSFSFGDFERSALCVQKGQWMFDKLKITEHGLFKSLMIYKLYFGISVSWGGLVNLD